MNVLLVASGESPRTNFRSLIKGFTPSFTDVLRKWSPLLPRRVLRSIIKGFGTSEKRFPIGLGYLSSALKKRGHAVSLLDRFADPGMWIDNLRDFDFVGVYTSTPCFEDALEILRLLEKENYRGKIAFGGPHTSLYPRTIPPRVDYVVQGEAEYVIADLVEGVYQTDKILCCQRVKDLDRLPRPDYELFLDQKRSYQLTFDFSKRNPIFTMNTSRGCPMACTFCSVRDIWGRLWRGNSAERIIEDIEYLRRQYNIGGVYFREDCFTSDKARVVKFCELLLQKKIDIVWACETRVDAASDENFVEFIARAGCRGFYIGAESGSQRMLDHYHKDATVEQAVKTCENAKKHGIAIAMSIIVAHPNETWKDRWATFDLIRSTTPEIVFSNPYRPEVTRHGSVDYPLYDPREIQKVVFLNGTWAGQKERMCMPRDRGVRDE